jgi:hypothetical protein
MQPREDHSSREEKDALLEVMLMVQLQEKVQN